MRSIIINSLLGLDDVEANVDTLISTGIFSICLCLYLGAREVNFTGFSFFKENKDHYYDEESSNSLPSLYETIHSFSLLHTKTLTHVVC